MLRTWQSPEKHRATAEEDLLMTSLVSKPAPDFTATAVMGDNTFNDSFALSSLRGQNALVFFYPLDFTFVCPSEIIAFDRSLDDFRGRETQVVGISVDSHYTHLAWKKTSVDRGGIGPIRYPLVSDLKREIARAYGVLHDDGVALRASFLIDRDGIVRHAVINDLPLGRSVPEALRMVDALRFNERRGELCPANWHEGEEGMVPSPEGVSGYLAKHLA
jgi:peroxiredoxin (alkyl hydroperoxide reductase subunit C)